MPNSVTLHPATAGQDGKSQNNPVYELNSVVRQWLPPLGTLPVDAKINDVTLAELATHTSCLTRDVPGQNSGLYCPGGAPDQTQIDAWRDNKNWLPRCTMGQSRNYSNWGTLTLGFAVAQPDSYDYDASLAKFILPYFGMTKAITNTCPDTVCVQGYGPGGNHTRPKNSAHSIRTNIAEITSFVSNYLYYSILRQFVPVTEKQQFLVDMVDLALKRPIEFVAVGLDWFISDFTVANASYTLFDKNGMSGAQGFSSYVGFINTPQSWPRQSLIQAGVLVLVNMAMQGARPTPTALGKSILSYLLGGGLTVSDDDEELEDSDPKDAR